MNQFVDSIEFYFGRLAQTQNTGEEISIIHLENRTTGESKFNYNMPVGQYFKTDDVVIANCELINAEPPIVELLEKDKIPVTVITGFLGSGKTTLLNRILKEKHGKRILVIQNEFGAIELDGTLVKDALKTEEDIITLDNGCLCCTVRGDLARAFANLVEKCKSDKVNVDSIMLETTGVADPAPIIQTFFQTPRVAASLKLDGILTVVDAKNILSHIDEVPKEKDKTNESVEQVSFADRILLNKMDLVSGPQLREVKEKIRSINSLARIHPTTQCQIPLEKILNIGAFSLERLLEKDSEFLKEESEYEEVTCDEDECDHDHGHSHKSHGSGDGKEKGHSHGHKEDSKHGHGHGEGKEKEKGHGHGHGGHGECEEKNCTEKGHGHSHDKKKHKHKKRKKKVRNTEVTGHSSGVSSIGIQRGGVCVESRFEQFMCNVVQNWGRQIYRSKGIINTGGPKKLVFHGVHELIDTNYEKNWGTDPRTNKIVFIGKNLKKELLTKGFEGCLLTEEEFAKLPASEKYSTQNPRNPQNRGMPAEGPRVKRQKTA